MLQGRGKVYRKPSRDLRIIYQQEFMLNLHTKTLPLSLHTAAVGQPTVHDGDFLKYLQ